MGGCCSKSSAGGPLTILVIGLDNGGKSTLTAALKGDLDPIVVPTIGFSAPTKARIAHADLVFYDLGGGARIRGVWPSYFAEVHGVVYVVDASDAPRLEESATELASALLHPMVVGKPVLIFANKQDLPSAMNEADISAAMGLDRVATLCRHHVQACTAKASANGGVMDERIDTGLRWLVEAVKADMQALQARRVREMDEFAAAERVRREKQAADYAAAKLKREAAAAAAVASAATQDGKPTAESDVKPVVEPGAGDGSGTTEAVPAPQEATAPAVNDVPPVASAPAPAAVEAPAPAAPAASAAILCTVCKDRPAVRRSGAVGWQAGCVECIEAAEERKRAAQAALEREEAAAAAAAGE